MVVSVVDRWAVVEDNTNHKLGEDRYVMSMMETKMLLVDVSHKVDDGNEIVLHGRSWW